MKILLKDIKSARWAIIIIIAYFAFLKNYIYTLCPLILLTGYPCPGCGMTRAMFRVMKLDLAGAWEIHPFIYPIGILVFAFCVSRYLLNGKGIKYIKGFVVVIAIGLIIFYCWRMITLYPDVPPMTYYENNYLHILKGYLLN